MKRARKRAKQAFTQLEVRVFRADKKTQMMEPGVRGQEVRKRPSHMTPEDDVREEYLSRLT